MQKRAARIILDAERTTRTLTMFNALNWMPFFIEAYISRCSMASKGIEGTLIFKNNLYTNLIAKQKETGNFEYFLNNF